MAPHHDRRLFLKYLGAGLSGLAMARSGALGPILEARGQASFAGFTPIQPSNSDELLLPPEFRYRIVAGWLDRLPGTSSRFGFNCDYTAFVPMRPDGTEGALLVNHESVCAPEGIQIGVYDQAFPRLVGRVPTVRDYMQDVGASVLHIRQDDGDDWQVVESPITRRYDATSRMRASGPALRWSSGSVGGTLANCSGCHTPWNTVLTCEENFQDYVADDVGTDGRGRIGGLFEMNGAHFGWVVEIDPLDPGWTPTKHTMLGRFRHENVAIRAAAGQRVVAYMGDDRTDGHVYKFVSDGTFTPGAPANRGELLSRGRLYAAVFNADGTGEWRELNEQAPLRPIPGVQLPAMRAGAATLGQVYSDLGAIVTDAFHASNLIGATPTGRPEDVEVHPFDQSVYIAFTAAATVGKGLLGNLYGELWRLVDEGDGTGTRFEWMRWKAGGPNDESQAGQVFAAPDNLCFDRAGNMWVVTDITSTRLNADARYTSFRNNGMFFLPTAGADAGVATQFASAPCEAELAGPTWTPDERTLFLSVQHPGEVYGMRMAGMPHARGSNWPDGPGRPPRPAVVAIRRR